jgi:hypothetical protein
MSIHEYLLKARQDDAVRAGERDRRLLEARRARMAGRHRPEPATVAATIARVAPVGWLARLMFRALPRRASGRAPTSRATRVPAPSSPAEAHATGSRVPN